MQIAVIGCGTMGAGIAEVLAAAGHHVAAFDADPSLTARLVDRVPAVRAATTLASACEGAAVVIEAVAEDETIKHDVLREVARAAPEAVVATNTSSIDATVLAGSVADRTRFLVAHFFHPATVVPLVELVPLPETAGATVDTMRDLLAGAGKDPVTLKRNVPGFVANRLQAALLREAFALERSGVADFADIDRVVTSGLGSRWAAAGPFGVVDLGGIDIWTSVTARLFPDLSADVEAPAALRERLSDGRLGAKSGQGLYAHEPVADDALRARIAQHFSLENPPPTG